MFRCVPELYDKARSIFTRCLEFMRQLIEIAQQADVIRTDTDAENLADIFASTCTGICLKWRMKDFSFSLREQTMKVISRLLEVFGSKNNIPYR